MEHTFGRCPGCEVKTVTGPRPASHPVVPSTCCPSINISEPANRPAFNTFGLANCMLLFEYAGVILPRNTLTAQGDIYERSTQVFPICGDGASICERVLRTAGQNRL